MQAGAELKNLFGISEEAGAASLVVLLASSWESSAPLRFLDFAQHRFNVDHGRTVDGFDWTDAQTVAGDLAYGNAMQANRVWAIGRASGKYAGKWPGPVGTWVNPQNVATCPVQPGQDDHLVAYRQPMQG